MVARPFSGGASPGRVAPEVTNSSLGFRVLRSRLISPVHFQACRERRAARSALLVTKLQRVGVKGSTWRIIDVEEVEVVFRGLFQAYHVPCSDNVAATGLPAFWVLWVVFARLFASRHVANSALLGPTHLLLV